MASGDLKYEERVQGTLTSTQRTSLGTLLAQLWPGALADLSAVSFSRDRDNGVSYELVGEQTKAPGLVPFGCRITGRVP